jgi:hypothetical protein
VLLLSPGKIAQVGQLLLSIGEVLLKAMLRAKLSMRKSVANQTEAATTGRAAHSSLGDIGILIFAHQQDFLTRSPGNARRLSV